MQVILTIKPQRCTLRFGEGPCTAALADGEPTQHKCYNTRTTCRDLPNIALVADDRSVVFTTDSAPRQEVIETQDQAVIYPDRHAARVSTSVDSNNEIIWTPASAVLIAGSGYSAVYESGVLLFIIGEPGIPPDYSYEPASDLTGLISRAPRDPDDITPFDPAGTAYPNTPQYISFDERYDRELIFQSVPAITSATIQSGLLEFEGVASENKATIHLSDETTLVDVDDPYSNERANCGGSRWGRLLDRDRLLQTAAATIQFKENDDDDWITTQWLVADITYPRNGSVVLKLTDPVTRKLAQPYPPEQSKALSADVDETSGTLPVAVGADESEYWRIGSEILRVANNNWQRAQLGTIATDHSNGDSVSPVRVFDEAPWHTAFKQVVDDALPGVTDADDINSKAQATQDMKVRVIAHRAEPFKTMLAQVCQAGQCAVYYDMFTGTLRHRPTTIFEEPDAHINASDILSQPPVIQTLVKAQKTRASYRFKLSNPTDNRSYTRHALAVDVDAEARLDYQVGDTLENQYAATGDAAAARRVQRYAELPIEASMAVDAMQYAKPRENGGGAICELGELVSMNYPESYQGVDGCVTTFNGHIKQFAIDLIKGRMSIKLWALSSLADAGGASNTINVSITSNATDVDLFNLAGQPFVEGLTINVLITHEVVIGGVTADAFTIAGFAAGTIINIICEGECWIIGAAGKGGGGGSARERPAEIIARRGHWSGERDGGNGEGGTRGIYITGDYEINFTGIFFVWAGGGGGGGGGTYLIASVSDRAPGGAGGWAGGFRLGQIFLPNGGGGGGGAGDDTGGSAGIALIGTVAGFRAGDDGDHGGPDGGIGGNASQFTALHSGAGAGAGGVSSNSSDGSGGHNAIGITRGLRASTSWYNDSGDGANGNYHFHNRNGNATIDQSAATITCGDFDVVIYAGA